MSDEPEDSIEEVSDGPTQPLLRRVLVLSASYPTKDSDVAEFIQRSTVVAHQLVELAYNQYVVLMNEAPMILQHTPIGMMLATFGHVLTLMEQAGLEWMTAHDIVPLDLGAEAARVAQHELDTATDIPDEIRAELEEIVAQGGVANEPIENWPDVIFGEEVH